MRFTTLFTTLAVVATGASATYSSASISTAITLTGQNHYGAPIAPWHVGHYPGWYYGKSISPKGIDNILQGLFCELLDLFPFCLHCPKPPPPPPPHHPPPPPEYSQVFHDLTCAAQDDSYLTYGLVDTVDDCIAMCDSVSGCTFFNTYHDVNGKYGSTQLTCALFKYRLTAASAINCGGQSQPDGSVDYITNSDGYYKTKATY
ncbi:hypothetical protein FB451DRAFT_1224388 [Mycena latifolia]|nr:hypothetical protein FB451DRAFT_1224292 [Mycena latifolia]KAJ7489286.1 hypothetical protein FB451DRAFT_1224385 [Mycena latifolia]KAJ7489289.1 hypothetical protein FB451DRAFT_1224388 [Mycena latifolia]